MSFKKIQVWESSDGELFRSEDEVRDHEIALSRRRLEEELEHFVSGLSTWPRENSSLKYRARWLKDVLVLSLGKLQEHFRDLRLHNALEHSEDPFSDGLDLAKRALQERERAGPEAACRVLEKYVDGYGKEE